MIKPQHVVETLWELTKDRETYITSDVGQHQMWAAQYYRFERAAPLDQLGRPRHDGRRPAVRDGHQARQARRRGRLHHRRRLDPDVHPGALDLPAVQDAGQDRLAQQPLPRAWCGSGSRSTTAAATRTATWTRCPTSSSSPRPTATSASDRKPGEVEPALREALRLKDRTCSSTSAPTRPRTSGRWSGGQGHHRDAASAREGPVTESDDGTSSSRPRWKTRAGRAVARRSGAVLGARLQHRDA